MSWRVADITETFPVTGTDGEVAQVTIRRMSEGDSHSMQQVGSSAIAEGKPLSQVLVLLRRYRVESFVTSWTLPFPVTPDAVLELAPELVDVIDEHVQLFNPGVFPRAQTEPDKARHAAAMAGVLKVYLDEEDDSVTLDDLRASLEAYEGVDVARPTESA